MIGAIAWHLLLVVGFAGAALVLPPAAFAVLAGFTAVGWFAGSAITRDR